MSLPMRQLEDMSNVRADFDMFLSQGKFEDARACIDTMGESYSELEALKMHQEWNRAKNYICTNLRGGCKDGHNRSCKEFNDETDSELEVSERSLRADEDSENPYE